MPIANGEIVQYNIPEEYKTFFTREVLELFKANLLGFFPGADDPYTCFFLESTSGWVEALTRAIKAQKPHDKCQELLDYYLGLEWYDFDMFNDEILHLAAELGVISYSNKDEAS